MDRKAIMDALVLQLENIVVANGYNTDVGNNIFVWKLTPLAREQMPALICRDTEESYDFEDVPLGMKQCNLIVEIDVLATSINDVRLVLLDIEKAIGQDETLGGNTEYINHLETLIEAEQHDNVIAFASCRIEIAYLTDRWRGA